MKHHVTFHGEVAATGSETERRWLLRQWSDEHDSAALYAALARLESDAKQARVYRALAASERMHTVFWEKRLRTSGHRVPRYRASLRTRFLIELARLFGTGFVTPSITVREMNDRDRYASLGDAETRVLADDEQHHAAAMRASADTALGNNLRAAVLGANDGVASNFCLMMGVAGGGAPVSTILLTGVAGLIGGACAMALGEWLSVTNARELALSQMERERGRPESTAGGKLDEHVVAGNARSAATLSFVLFALGAAVPLLSFSLLTGWEAIVGSAALALAALFALGAATSLFNGRSALFSGGRQVLIGAAAAAVTFAAGHIFDALHGAAF